MSLLQGFIVYFLTGGKQGRFTALQNRVALVPEPGKGLLPESYKIIMVNLSCCRDDSPASGIIFLHIIAEFFGIHG